MNIIAKTKRTVLVPFQDVLDQILYGTEIEEEEIESNYRQWFHDPDITQHNHHGLFPYSKKAMKEYRSTLENNDLIVWAIIVKKRSENYHIGNITLQKINWIYRSAEMAIVIGEKSYWSLGYATETLTALFNHGFNRLNLHRIWSGTAQTNGGMIRVFQKLKMKHEGTFKDAMFLNSDWVDVMEFAVLEPEWHTENLMEK